MGKQRYTQTVARGLGFIRGYINNELDIAQDSGLECRCDGCKVAFGYCDCAERDVRHQCENCRRHRDVSDAIAWLDGQIEAHKPAKEDS